ncbi:hypothetical protein EVAR_84340_1 [Eumeta japonica]|uniref:Uncharacterized protein n=1 Tax=Eumeta variegata TaxID=151549 RepID=A0A4C1U519_EUMVA|nr:hypothetical protein EVAR_84340_1 [Eumeta japonica]
MLNRVHIIPTANCMRDIYGDDRRQHQCCFIIETDKTVTYQQIWTSLGIESSTESFMKVLRPGSFVLDLSIGLSNLNVEEHTPKMILARVAQQVGTEEMLKKKKK